MPLANEVLMHVAGERHCPTDALQYIRMNIHQAMHTNGGDEVALERALQMTDRALAGSHTAHTTPKITPHSSAASKVTTLDGSLASSLLRHPHDRISITTYPDRRKRTDDTTTTTTKRLGSKRSLFSDSATPPKRVKSSAPRPEIAP